MLISPRLADDLDAMAVLRETVDECDDASGTRKRSSPLLEAEVGGDDRGALLVASADDVVEDVCGSSTTATEPPDRKTWNAHADKANAQIKSQGGTGEISFDWTAVDLAQSKEFDIPAAIGNFLNGKMTSDRLRNVTYFEIVWKDSDGVQHVTSRERLPDGTLSLVTTK